MLNHLFCKADRWSRLLALSGGMLAFGCPAARAQAATKQAWDWVNPNALIYLDGKPSTLAEIRQIPDEAWYSTTGMQLYGDKHANQPGSNVIAQSAELFTTKANADSPAVRALADRFYLREGYTEAPAPVSAIAPKGLAYITSHYPQAWLGGEVMARTQKSTGAVRYHVQLADRWGWRYVDFTPEGEVVEHPMASPIAMMLALTLAYPHAVVATSPQPQAPIYLDGQRISAEAVRALSPDSLASVVVLNKDVAPLLAPDAAGLGLLIITTKQGQNQPATAFAKRVRQLQAIQQLAANSREALPAPAELAVLPQPTSGLGGVHYYLDNKPITQEQAEKLNPDTLASVDVVSGGYAQDTTASGVVLLKTKQLPQVAADSSRHPRKRVN